MSTVNNDMAEKLARRYCGGAATEFTFSKTGLRLMLQECAEWAALAATGGAKAIPAEVHTALRHAGLVLARTTRGLEVVPMLQDVVAEAAPDSLAKQVEASVLLSDSFKQAFRDEFQNCRDEVASWPQSLQAAARVTQVLGYVDEGTRVVGFDPERAAADARAMQGGLDFLAAHSTRGKPPQFPTLLRKMWSAGEVQAWIDENWQKSTAVTVKEE